MTKNSNTECFSNLFHYSKWYVFSLSWIEFQLPCLSLMYKPVSCQISDTLSINVYMYLYAKGCCFRGAHSHFQLHFWATWRRVVYLTHFSKFQIHERIPTLEKWFGRDQSMAEFTESRSSNPNLAQFSEFCDLNELRQFLSRKLLLMWHKVSQCKNHDKEKRW